MTVRSRPRASQVVALDPRDAFGAVAALQESLDNGADPIQAEPAKARGEVDLIPRADLHKAGAEKPLERARFPLAVDAE